MADAPLTYSIDACDEAFVRDFCPYKGSPDPLTVWRAAWSSAMASTPSPPVAAPPATPAELSLLSATWLIGQMLDLLESWEPLAPNPKLEAIEWAAQEWLADPTTQPQPQPAQPLTGARSDEMRRQMIDECGDDYEKRGIFASGWLGAEQAHGITAPSTPTPPEVAP